MAAKKTSRRSAAGGRRPKAPVKKTSPGGEFVLAIDLGGTKLSVAVVNRSGKIVAGDTEPVDTSSTNAPIWQMARMAEGIAESRGGRLRVRAAGVAVPGLVRRNGTVWAPNLPAWTKVPLGKLLQSRLRVPIAVDSDRNAAVIGEAWQGAAKGRGDVVALIVGTGIGAGILSGGQLVRGAHELAGCAGWLVVTEEDNEDMRQVGCLESLASGPAIARAAQVEVLAESKTSLAKLPVEELTSHDVAEAARNRDAVANEIFRSAGRALGTAVANLISVFDPEVLVIGGGLAQAAELFMPELERIALDRSQPLAAREVKIKVSKLGGKANLLGAAKMAWEQADS